MKKSARFCAIVVLLLGIHTAAQASQTIVIGPYADMETSAEGEILVQLEGAATQMKNIKIGFMQKLRIYIVASANKTGPKADNDVYARDRGVTVEGFLKTRLPNAEIAGYSVGTQFDAREVRIDWELVYMYPRSVVALALIVGIVAITLLIYVVIISSSVKKQQVTILQKQLGSPVSVKFGGEWYNFIPELNEDGVPLALHYVVKNGKPAYLAFKKSKDLIDSVEKSLRDNPELIRQLEHEKRWRPLSS